MGVGLGQAPNMTLHTIGENGGIVSSLNLGPVKSGLGKGPARALRPACEPVTLLMLCGPWRPPLQVPVGSD